MTVIGIDVSKAKLDVCWLREPKRLKVKTKVFPNTDEGHQALLAWLEAHTQRAPGEMAVMLEATGVYHEALCHHLYGAGVAVFLANPRHVSDYRGSLGRRSKTDKKDSVVLARFLHSRSDHQPWQPEPPEVRHLKALLARIHALETDLQRERNRQEKAQVQQTSALVRESIEQMIGALAAERERLLREVADHFDNHPDLKTDRAHLESIPGVGAVLSRELVGMLRSRAFTSAAQVAAFLGLVPVGEQSGTSVRTPARLSKAGPARLRAKLYMAAVVATRHNPHIRAQYQRLRGRGKSTMAALGAAMRKLVQIAYGVLKHQTDYDPQWAN